MEKRAGGCLGFLIGTVVLLGALFAWDEFLLKPFKQLGSHDLAWILGDLLSFRSETYEQPAEGWLFLAAATVLSVLFIGLVAKAIKAWLSYMARADAPVSILETTVHVRVLDANMREAEIRRSQKIHANQPKVDAYHYKLSTTYGEIIDKSWKFESYIDDEKVSGEPLIRYMSKSLEVIERFEQALPRNILVTYLPRSIVQPAVRVFGWFSKTIVTRRTVIAMRDEYNTPNPMFQITCVRYPTYNLEIIVDLPESANRPARDFQGFLISDNVVEKIPVIETSSLPPEAGRKVYSIKRKRLTKHQAIRLQWITDDPA